VKLVIAIVRPDRANDVLEALYRAEVRGVSMILRVIGLFMPLRATEREESLGMDIVQHGEEPM
jgi:ammonia channel protein AmtB